MPTLIPLNILNHPQCNHSHSHLNASPGVEDLVDQSPRAAGLQELRTLCRAGPNDALRRFTASDAENRRRSPKGHELGPSPTGQKARGPKTDCRSQLRLEGFSCDEDEGVYDDTAVSSAVER